MVLIKKRDVESYFSSRKRKRIHAFRPVSQPDATGFSGEVTGNAAVNSEDPAGDTLTQPTSSGIAIPVIGVVLSDSAPLAPVASKSAQS